MRLERKSLCESKLVPTGPEGRRLEEDSDLVLGRTDGHDDGNFPIFNKMLQLSDCVVERSVPFTVETATFTLAAQ